MRLLDRRRPRWSPLVLVAALGLLAAACGSSSTSGTTQPSTTSTTVLASHLEPAPVGQAQCHASGFNDKSVYAQIAIAKTNCEVAAMVASGSDKAKGASYKAQGFTCAAVAHGAGSTWASAWGGTYYAYSCADGDQQVAFNWGTDYTYGQSSTTSVPPVTSASGKLEPAALGQGQCEYEQFNSKSVVAQIAVANTTCAVEALLARGASKAKGAAYSTGGFSCSATSQGAGSTWASAWGGTYYSYSCVDGNEQVAFNWGTDYTY